MRAESSSRIITLILLPVQAAPTLEPYSLAERILTYKIAAINTDACGTELTTDFHSASCRNILFAT